MNFSITEVDQVIERTGCTYEEAKEALLATDGAVLDAIIYIEDKNKTIFDRMRDVFSDGGRTADVIVDKIKETIKEGSVNRIAVRDKDGRTITSVPVNAGAAAGVVAIAAGVAPLVLITGLVAKYGLDCKFVIIKADGSEITI